MLPFLLLCCYFVFVQDDSKLEKLGLRLGFGKVDHNAEVVDQTAVVELDSNKTGRVSSVGFKIIVARGVKYGCQCFFIPTHKGVQ